MADAPNVPPGASILFIDGTCVYCNRLVGFILRHDKRGAIYFAHLQGPLAERLIRALGGDSGDIDALYMIADAGTARARLLTDGEVGRAIWPNLFRIAYVLYLIPLPVLNFFYRRFASIRYRLFGQYDACRIPSAEERKRFLE